MRALCSSRYERFSSNYLVQSAGRKRPILLSAMDTFAVMIAFFTCFGSSLPRLGSPAIVPYLGYLLHRLELSHWR